MAGVANPNLPTYYLDAAAVTARNAEYPGTPFTDDPGDGSYDDPYLGCNRAASCSPGIGIATGVIDPKLEDWSILDQGVFAGSGGQPVGVARDPQDSQHLGGAGFVNRSSVDHPSSGGQEGLGGATPINARVGVGFNDTLTYIAALAQAAPGGQFGVDGITDPVNRTDQTVEIGDVLWGTNTV